VRTTAVVNQKGGVGKTATTLNLGGALAESGQRVLLVDLDPQGHLTDALGMRHAEPGPGSLRTALVDGAAPPVPARHSDELGLEVLTTNVDMFTVARELDQLRARESRLARHLRAIGAAYDHCLIDCPPTLCVLTDNALTAADGVLIPVQAEDSSLLALRLLLAQVEALESEVRGTRLVLHGLVVSMLERGSGGLARSNLGRSVVAELEQLPLPVLATIPRGVLVAEAWRVGQPVVAYAPESEHAQLYRALAKTLMDGGR
jgi:chromosome partitioning protein